jgi:tetratricopeptide (TPR) repeat protein
MLVLLDNAVSARQVRPLLPAGGSLALVTSREALHGLVARDGAGRVRLPVFTVDESVEMLTHLLGETKATADRPRLAELAQLCGNLPLALRIAAAQLSDQDDAALDHYLRRLRADRLGPLSVPGDEEVAVRGTFDWSYAALPAAVRRMFRHIGLLPGPDLTAATGARLADVTVEQAESMLERLVDAHLLERRAPARYGCHDLLKEYARQCAIAEERHEQRAAAQERLLRWYCERTEEASRRLAEPSARLWLETERPNLLAAVHWSQVDGPRELGRRLGESMIAHVAAGRFLTEGRRLGEALLAGAHGEPKGMATGRISLATTAIFAGDYHQGLEHARSALTLSERAGWVGGQVRAHSLLASGYLDLGEMEHAIEQYHHVLALAHHPGAPLRAASPLGGLGAIHYYLGRSLIARDLLRRALAAQRRDDSLVGRAGILDYLGGAYHQLGHLDEARRTAAEALALAEPLGRTGIQVGALMVLAEVAMDVGNPARAVELADQAVEVATRAPDRNAHAYALVTLAAALARQGRHPVAIDAFTEAMAIARQLGCVHAEAVALVGRAHVNAVTGAVDAALADADDAQRTSGERGFLLLRARARHALAVAYLARGEPDLAGEPLVAAARIHVENGHRLYSARVVHTARQVPGLVDGAATFWRRPPPRT